MRFPALTTFLFLSLSMAQSAPPQARYIPLGDSLSLGGWSPSDEGRDNVGRGMAWPAVAAAISHQRLTILRNAGVFGNTTAQMLARVDKEVIVYKPEIVTVAGGTNDITQAIKDGVTPASAFNLEASAANTRAIVGKLRSAGIKPVLVTAPPINTGWPAVTEALKAWNAWTRNYATQEKLPLIDMYPVTADVSDHWKEGYTVDGTHPSGIGVRVMGQTAWRTLASIIGPRSPESLQSQAAWKGALPTGWVWDDAFKTHDTNQVKDSGLIWWKVVRGANGGPVGAGITVPLKAMAGHRVRVALRAKTQLEAGRGEFTATVALNDAKNKVLGVRGLAQQYNVDLDGTYIQEFDLPQGVVSARIQWQLGGGAGQVSLTGLTVRDLGPIRP